ncbi:MAG: hypothetical protein B655_1798 [Methanobacterium sp. Maddingley MBC34]|nr:MAG: hypothetical protein B655_1798 [Methanobacterium sp. Maddingley MBC34]
MIMITETITAKPGQNDIIIEKSQYLIEYARLKPGCVSYHVYTSTENKDFLLMMDHWKNTEVLEVNLQTEHFNVFGVAIEDIIVEELDIGIYSVDKKFF